MGQCMAPFAKRDEITGKWMDFPCGKCPECYSRRISGWSFRLVKEGQTSESALFVTLTYDTQFVPISKNGFMNLDKSDVQKYFKRLRKRHEKRYRSIPKEARSKIKYYTCGEYGDSSMRPHYHAIIYNAHPEDLEMAWTDPATKYRLGTIHIGKVTEASIGYTLKYMSKPKKVPLFNNDDRLPEFSLMSKGLGANYITPEMARWHKSDLYNRMFCALPEGKKIAMPRYYKDKIYSEAERKAISKHVEKQHLEEDIRKTDEDHRQDLDEKLGKIRKFQRNQRIKTKL